MKRKTVYISPVTDVLLLQSESLLDPASWNPDYPYTGNMGIKEEDPDDSYDGHGAKANDPYAFMDIDWDEDFWESDVKSLWD